MDEFTQDHKAFFYEVNDEHPLIVYRLLMHEKTRICLLNNDNLKQSLTTFQHIPDEEKHPQIQKYFKFYTGPNKPFILTPATVLIIQRYKCSINAVFSNTEQFLTVKFLFGNGNSKISNKKVRTEFSLLKDLKYSSSFIDSKVIYMEV